MGGPAREALTRARRVGFTAEDRDGAVHRDQAGLLGAEVRAQLDEGVRVSLFAADPKPTVIVPTVASVSSVNRAARALPGVTFSARLAGAIHSTDMTGVASA